MAKDFRAQFWCSTAYDIPTKRVVAPRKVHLFLGTTTAYVLKAFKNLKISATSVHVLYLKELRVGVEFWVFSLLHICGLLKPDTARPCLVLTLGAVSNIGPKPFSTL